MKKITKALVPAAGFGTRFLPASKAIPKVMFPVIDKPIVQIVVEELVASGIKDITFVLSPFTQDIREHFESFSALNHVLLESGKKREMEELEKIEKMAKFSYVEQRNGRRGTGIAILSAREAIGNEPFVLCWADEFFKAEPPRPKQLIDVYNKFGGIVFGCIRTTDPRDGSRFGFVTGKKVSNMVTKVEDFVEKPGVGKAPSDLASVSGMVLLPKIFDYLEKADKIVPKDKELYHVDGLRLMIEESYPVFALEYQNCRYFDTGDRFGYLRALVELGLESEEFGDSFRKYLEKLV